MHVDLTVSFMNMEDKKVDRDCMLSMLPKFQYWAICLLTYQLDCLGVNRIFLVVGNALYSSNNLVFAFLSELGSIICEVFCDGVFGRCLLKA